MLQDPAARNGAGPRLPVGVVTDSMADLPESWVREGGIRVVPLYVLVGERSLRDGVDITREEFFRWLRQAPAHRLPRTSHPTPADFLQVYEALSGQVGAIVSLHASAEISATYHSALMAARQLGSVPVEVVDTRLVSLAEGLVVREAARAARAGASAEEVVRRARALAGRVRIRFTVETLEYLARNGRIGRARAWVGGILQLKPVLGFEEGVVVPVERVRGRASSLRRLAELVEQELGGQGETLAVIHADAEQAALELRDQVLQRCRFDEVVVGSLGATIGAHVGPGTVGVAYVARPEQAP